MYNQIQFKNECTELCLFSKTPSGGGDKIHIRTLLQYMVTPNVSCAYIKSVCINKTGQMNHSPGCISVIGCNLCETQMDVFMNT